VWCPYAAVAADSLEKLKGDSIAVLEYHGGDTFENTDALGRMTYYFGGAIPFPSAIFDGTSEVIGGEPGVLSDYLSAYYTQMINDSPCALNVLVEYDSTTRFLEVKSRVTALDTFSNTHLRYAIVESHIYHRWGSVYSLELDSLHHVVRKMLPNYNGTAFSIMPGESFVDSQSYTLDAAWNDRNCYVVVFVQRDDSGDFNQPVLRSAKRELFQIQTWVFGDADGDGIVDLTDIVYLSKYLFVHGSPPDPLASGDPNNDCILNIADVVYLINYVFGEGPEPLEGCAW
jgi:hypothetical protein